ncbi:MAG TPA: hypothetical protein VGK99_01280 [Acidobacteriota bacterium]|jgi:hypothetical protein
MNRNTIWHNNLLAKCYLVYSLLAGLFLFFVVLVNSQGASGETPLLLIFVIAFTSPLPMLVIGSGLLRRKGWVRWAGIALPFLQTLALLKQLKTYSSRVPIADLEWQSSLLFYICSAQVYYLPGGLLLGIYLTWFTFSERGRMLYSRRA